VDRRFEFHKRSQFFICPHNEALTVAAMRVSNPDCSPLNDPTLKRNPSKTKPLRGSACFNGLSGADKIFRSTA
jgi:hypothetical protein